MKNQMKFKKGDIVEVVAKDVQEGTVGTVECYAGVKNRKKTWRLHMSSMAGSWYEDFPENELKPYVSPFIKPPKKLFGNYVYVPVEKKTGKLDKDVNNYVVFKKDIYYLDSDDYKI